MTIATRLLFRPGAAADPNFWRPVGGLLPDARLYVVRGGYHDLVHARADEVAPLIERHLGEGSDG